MEPLWREDEVVAALVRELAPEHAVEPVSERMLRVCLRLWWMLHHKNRNYGNSALSPLRIFSKASPIEQLLVRLDDKLSRLARGSAAGEDAELDAMGYLVLLRLAREAEQ